MKKHLFLIVIICALALGHAGCKNELRKDTAAGTVSDSDITEAVKSKLESSNTVLASKIDVDTKDGVVTLSGEMQSQADADEAIRVARSVPEVKNVISKLEVKPVLTNKDAEERLEEREEQMEDAAKKDEKQTVTGAVDDAGITTKVKMKLANDDLVSALKIDVDTKDGMVTLTGTVKSELEARRAIELAESVEGVKRVTSVLTVKPD